MISDHFLDTNVIIGSRIKWDNQRNAATRYMATNSVQRHISQRVYDEASEVFERIRSIINSFLDKLGNVRQRFSATPLRHYLDNVIREFRTENENRLNNNVWKALLRFIEKNFEDIEYSINKGKNEILIYKRKIVRIIQEAILSYQDDCEYRQGSAILLHDGFPPDYSDKEEYTKLRRIMGARNIDIHILLDSYYLGQAIILTGILFITFDKKDITSKKEDIENVLNGITIYEAP